jgi:hypothetical protein
MTSPTAPLVFWAGVGEIGLNGTPQLLGEGRSREIVICGYQVCRQRESGGRTLIDLPLLGISLMFADK